MHQIGLLYAEYLHGETFCACCFFCSVCANQQHLHNLILSVYIVQLFLPFLRNSDSATIALSRERERERWKWKWIEFPEIQRVSFPPSTSWVKFILIVKMYYESATDVRNLQDTDPVHTSVKYSYIIHKNHVCFSIC